MKRFFTIGTLVLATLLSTTLICSSIHAINITTDGGTATQNVNVTYSSVPQIETPDVISVDVSWPALGFTYSDNRQIKTWNPATHTYSTETDSTPVFACQGNANVIKVTNHSNVKVSVNLNYASESEYSNQVTGSFTASSFNLNTAVDTEVNNAPNASSIFTLSGTLTNPSDFSMVKKIGTITLTVAKATD